MMVADGFRDALIGYARRPGDEDDIAIYSYDKCVQILMDRDGMEYSEAVEFMDFNVEGAWMGDGTPMFMRDIGDYPEEIQAA